MWGVWISTNVLAFLLLLSFTFSVENSFSLGCSFNCRSSVRFCTIRVLSFPSVRHEANEPF